MNDPPRLFLFDERIAKIVHRNGHPPTVKTLSKAELRRELSKAARWVQSPSTLDKDGVLRPGKSVSPDWSVVNNLVCRGAVTDFLILRGFKEAPFARANGSVVEEEGFDCDSGYYVWVPQSSTASTFSDDHGAVVSTDVVLADKAVSSVINTVPVGAGGSAPPSVRRLIAIIIQEDEVRTMEADLASMGSGSPRSLWRTSTHVETRWTGRGWSCSTCRAKSRSRARSMVSRRTEPREILDVSEAAAYLKVGERFIRRLVQERRIRILRYGEENPLRPPRPRRLRLQL